METFNIFAARGVWDSENERDGCRHAGEQTWPLQELEPGHVVAFPEGPAGARQVRNVTDESVRVVFFSSKSPLAIVHYPDSGKVGLWSQARGYQAMLRAESKLDYWEGEA